MKKFGIVKIQTLQKKEEERIFYMRLHLLIVMVKAALKGYPIGKYRKKAALENAAAVHKLVAHIDLTFPDADAMSHLFKERVKLLSVMATAIVSQDYPLGMHRKEAVIDNIQMISQHAFPDTKLYLFPNVLNVA